MWVKFTERARRVILAGQEEAGKMGSDGVETEHLLLGLLSENEGAGSQVLQQMGITREVVRAEIGAESTHSGGNESAEPRLTPKAKRVLELAADEARRMRHNYIGTEHLLLALLREKDGLAAKVLRKLGLNLDEVRTQVVAYLGAETSDNDVSKRIVSHTTNVFQLTAQAQLVLEVAKQEAYWLKQPKIDIKHLLLAMLSAPDCTDVLSGLGLDVEATRQRVREQLKPEQSE